MNALAWTGLMLVAWARPVYFHYTVTKRVNGHVASQRDYVQIAALVIGLILLFVGLFA